MIDIPAEALRKVNAIRHRAQLGPLDEDELRRRLDWTDLPRSPNLTLACLPRFGQVLGYKVSSNTDGGCVYLCVRTAEDARALAIAIGGSAEHWTTFGELAPRDHLGHTVLLPADVVSLAGQASGVVLETWNSQLRSS